LRRHCRPSRDPWCRDQARRASALCQPRWPPWWLPGPLRSQPDEIGTTRIRCPSPSETLLQGHFRADRNPRQGLKIHCAVPDPPQPVRLISAVCSGLVGSVRSESTVLSRRTKQHRTMCDPHRPSPLPDAQLAPWPMADGGGAIRYARMCRQADRTGRFAVRPRSARSSTVPMAKFAYSCPTSRDLSLATSSSTWPPGDDSGRVRFDSVWSWTTFSNCRPWWAERTDARGVHVAWGVGRPHHRVQLGPSSPRDVSHPGILAKIVTTLDIISRGRAILGIGGAWYDVEHQASASSIRATACASTCLKRRFRSAGQCSPAMT